MTARKAEQSERRVNSTIEVGSVVYVWVKTMKTWLLFYETPNTINKRMVRARGAGGSVRAKWYRFSSS